MTNRCSPFLFAAVCAVLLSFGLGGVTAARAEVKAREVTYTINGQTFKSYLAWDDAVKGRRPAVLVAPEWWGVDDYTKGRARQLAAAGYVAMAVDMYGDGLSTNEVPKASELSGKLFASVATVRERAGAALGLLRQQPETDPTRVVAIGYCMGGAVALELARSGTELVGVVALHAGRLKAADPADNKRIRGAVLVLHGQADPLVKAEEIEGFHAQMAEAKVDYQFVSYGGALHAFSNPGADAFRIPGVGYQKAAEERSTRLMFDFLRERFGTLPPPPGVPAHSAGAPATGAPAQEPKPRDTRQAPVIPGTLPGDDRP